MLNVKQGSCEYQFQNHWFDPTRNQTQVYSSTYKRSIPLGYLSCQISLNVFFECFTRGAANLLHSVFCAGLELTYHKNTELDLEDN